LIGTDPTQATASPWTAPATPTSPATPPRPTSPRPRTSSRRTTVMCGTAANHSAPTTVSVGSRTIGGNKVAERPFRAGGVDGHQVGVVQAGRGPGFALEALAQLRCGQHLDPRYLEGHLPAQLRVERQVDDAEGAAAQLAPQLEAAETGGDRGAGGRGG